MFSTPSSRLQPLTAAQRRRGLVISLINSFLILTGFFTFITFFALHFTNHLGFAAATVGLVLGIRQIVQQGLDIFGGFIADHIGYRTSIAIGCLIRAVGFGAAGFSTQFPQLLVSALLMGVGGVFFDAAGTGALASYASVEQRGRIFALQATINNIGAALGPVIAFVLYVRFGFPVVALVSAGFFVFVAFQAYFLLPEGTVVTKQGQITAPLSIRQTFAAILARRAYARIVLLLMGFWIIGSQMSLTVALDGQRLGGKDGVAILLGLNAFLAIPLQYPLVRFVERFLKPTTMMAISSLVTGAGLVMVFMADHFAWQIAGVVLITCGTLAILPVMSAITAQVAPPSAMAAFYGFSVLGLGIGGGVGQYIGGRIYDLQAQLHTMWLMPAFAVLVAVTIAYALYHSPSPLQVTAPVEEPEFHPERSGIVAAR